MKKIVGEFKKFITRGNIVDMAVGVIIGSAFTAIVTALTNSILKPLINGILYLIMGSGDATNIYTFLVPAYDAEDHIDLTKSIYIDWGAFINAFINFLLIAIVLFTIIKIINVVKEKNMLIQEEMENAFKKNEIKKEMKEKGIDCKKKGAIKKYIKDKKEQVKLKAEEDAKKTAEEAKLHSTEGLLEQIKALLEEQNKKLENK